MVPYCGFCAASTRCWNRHSNHRQVDPKYFDRQSPIKHQVRNSAAHRQPWLHWLPQPVSRQQPTRVKWWEGVSDPLPAELPLVLLQWLSWALGWCWVVLMCCHPPKSVGGFHIPYIVWKSLSTEKNCQEFLGLLWAALPELRGEELPPVADKIR